MKWIGLTGSIGSGKTTVAAMFAERGVPVINTDEIAHAVIRKGTAGFTPLVEHFGKVILKDDGEIDRKKLAEKIFGNDVELKFVEHILHPLIRDEVKHRTQKLAQQKNAARFCIIEIPLLFETSWDHMMSATIVVWCDPAEALKRASERLQISLKETKQRDAAQMPLEAKKQLATYLIDNSSHLAATRAQVQAVYQKLMSEN